jgi:uncharacterized protein (TIGR02147 family)
MEIYKHKSYREALKAWLKEQPKEGRGVAQRISESLNISTVLVSQILNGQRTLQMDYAFNLAKFMGLTATETDYFLLLVQYENAGVDSYKKYLMNRIEVIHNSNTEVKNRVSQDIHLSEQDKAQFYSHWHYSAIRLLTDVPGRNTVSAISQYLELPPTRVSEVLEFLVKCNLCSLENGKFKMAVRSTHLSSDSPWVYSRQLQWRQRAIQSMETPSKDSVFYTGPMVLSKDDADWVRDYLISAIGKVTERARDSESEEMMCLNIDWFGLHRD